MSSIEMRMCRFFTMITTHNSKIQICQASLDLSSIVESVLMEAQALANVTNQDL
jgi:hypothetical protein